MAVLPEHIVVGVVIEVAADGTVPGVTDKVSDLDPHVFVPLAIIFPVLEPTVAVMELLVLVPDHPEPKTCHV